MIKKQWEVSFYQARNRCTNKKYHKYKRYGGRGIKFLMTIEDFKFLWNRDKGYLMKRPSIDRIDNDGHYELNNCRFIELGENSRRANVGGLYHSTRKINQFSLEGKFIRTWHSGTEAARALNINCSNIYNVLRGQNIATSGYIWKRA